MVCETVISTPETQFLIGGPGDKGFGDAGGQCTFLVVQVVVDEPVVVLVGPVLTIFAFGVDVVTGGVLAAFLADGEEDRVVVHTGTIRVLVRVVVPLLYEKYAGLGAGVGLECVAVQTNDGEDAGMFSYEVSDVRVGGVVEAPLR